MTELVEQKVLVLGGARSGKSRHAEGLLAGRSDVTYIATGLPPNTEDPEWRQRVLRHQQRRPSGWRTVETTELAAAVGAAHGPVLIDCIGTWLARMLDELGAWEETVDWQGKLDERIAQFLAALAEAKAPVLVVSNEVGMGVVPATASGRLFRDLLGGLNHRIGDVLDSVHLVVAGRVLRLTEWSLDPA